MRLFARFCRVREESERVEHLRDELVVAHLNLVRYLAVKFANRGEPLDDLIQVGTVGLLKAIDRFDLERGVEFTTYATPTIVGEIKRYFRDKGWAVKVPRRLQELNLAVNRAIEKLAVELGRSPDRRRTGARTWAPPKKRSSKRKNSARPTICSRSTPMRSAKATRKSQTLADTSAEPTIPASRCWRTAPTSSAPSRS